MTTPQPLRLPPEYDLAPPDEIKARLAGLRRDLEGVADAAVISWPADLYYLTGSNQMGYLVVSPDRDPVYLVRRSVERALAETPVAVDYLPGFGNLPELVIDHLGRRPDRLALSLDVLPSREATSILAGLGGPEPVELSPLIMELRSVKSDWELAQMKRAGQIFGQVIAEVPGLLRPGLTETSLAGRMMFRAMDLGAQAYMRTRNVVGEMYPWHVVSGERTLLTSRVEAPFGGLGISPSFPQGCSVGVIEPGDMIVIDFGVCYMGYLADLTRMVAWGRPPDRAMEAYRSLQTIQARLMEGLKPGVDGHELYLQALETAEETGFGLEFLGQGRSEIKFVGHGVGLEISEPPYLAAGRHDILRANQTLALELKMVLPGLGAVGLENTVVVTDRGGVSLGPADDELTIVEVEA